MKLPRHLKAHPSAAAQRAWCYQKAIPRDLRALFTPHHKSCKQPALIVVYLPMSSLREAADRVDALASRDRRLFDALRRLSTIERATIIAAGGLKALDAHVGKLEQLLNAPDIIEDKAETMRRLGEVLQHDPDAFLDQMRVNAARWRRDARAQEPVARALALRVKPTQREHSIDGLFDLWVERTHPKHTQSHRASVALFKAHFGDIDVRGVTSPDIARWVEKMLADGKTPIATKKAKTDVSALFTAALAVPHRTGITVHPVRGVSVALPRNGKKENKAFTPAQLRALFEKAEAITWGGKHHGGLMWWLRLMIHTGCRPNEIAQLQRGDVMVRHGVPCLRLRQECAATGHKHPQKSMKNDRPRWLPLHTDIADAFLAYASGGDPGAFVFSALPYGEKGRYTFIKRYWRKLGAPLRPYAIRDAFIDGLRNAGVPMERAYYLTDHGQGTVHASYGDGLDIRVLQADVNSVRPLEDVAAPSLAHAAAGA